MAGGIFARRARLLVRIMRLGKPAPRFDDVPQRVRQEAVVAIGQRKLLQRLGPGVMHALIFWGFIVLFPTIIMAMIAAVDRDATLPWLGHQGGFAFLVDLFALLVKLRGEQHKLRMLDAEAAAALGDAALAQDHDLFAMAEGVHDDGPFLECGAHAGSFEAAGRKFKPPKVVTWMHRSAASWPTKRPIHRA